MSTSGIDDPNNILNHPRTDIRYVIMTIKDGSVMEMREDREEEVSNEESANEDQIIRYVGSGVQENEESDNERRWMIDKDGKIRYKGSDDGRMLGVSFLDYL